MSIYCKKITAATVTCSEDEIASLKETEMEMQEAQEKLELAYEAVLEDILAQTGSTPTEEELESFVPETTAAATTTTTDSGTTITTTDGTTTAEATTTEAATTAGTHRWKKAQTAQTRLRYFSGLLCYFFASGHTNTVFFAFSCENWKVDEWTPCKLKGW